MIRPEFSGRRDGSRPVSGRDAQDGEKIEFHGTGQRIFSESREVGNEVRLSFVLLYNSGKTSIK